MDNFKLLIDGALVDGADSFDVVNPATGDRFASSPHASLAQCEAAISAAKTAYPSWSKLAYSDRRGLLMKLADAVSENADDLARLLVLEQGKPLAEAQAEVAYSEAFIRVQAGFDLEVEVIEDSDEKRVETHHKPLGVVAGIIPWNFPLLVTTFKLPPALLAGNTIVVKPAPTTPLTTLKFGELCAEIFPPGVVNIITDQNELGPVLSSHQDIAKVSITGSTETGKKVMASAAETIKRITLELGGNDAGIVLDDADPEVIAPGIVSGAFMNAGQVCIAMKRCYVHTSIYDRVVEELVKRVQELVVGDGLQQGVTVGPLQNKRQFERAVELLADAASTGKIVAGGKVSSGGGFFVEPTIVADAKDGTRIVDEEQFAPILPIIRYDGVNEAVDAANALEFGLGASVWSSDEARAYDTALQLEAGTVWVNKHLDFGPHIPFGGAKQSGFGAEFAIDGLKEYTQTVVVNIAKQAA